MVWRKNSVDIWVLPGDVNEGFHNSVAALVTPYLRDCLFSNLSRSIPAYIQFNL